MLQMYMVQAYPMQGGLGLSEGVNYALAEVWVALKCFQTAVQATVKAVLRDVFLQVVCLSVPVFYSDDFLLTLFYSFHETTFFTCR